VYDDALLTTAFVRRRRAEDNEQDACLVQQVFVVAPAPVFVLEVHAHTKCVYCRACFRPSEVVMLVDGFAPGRSSVAHPRCVHQNGRVL